MAGDPVSELPEEATGWRSGAADPVEVAALAAVKVAIAIGDAWRDALDAVAFDAGLDNPDSEERRRRGLLERERGRLILSLLWNQSQYVRRESLICVGGRKLSGPAPVTCHRLAVILEEDGVTLEAQCKRVRSVVHAAEHYGLARFGDPIGNANPVEGTERLHQLMMGYAGALSEAMAVAKEEASP